MIVTVPIYYYPSDFGWSGGFRKCTCTWTVCQCMYQPWSTTYVIETKPLSKGAAIKQRIESIPKRHEPESRARLHRPHVRPSIQALSMRIR